jgi:hypothetical protein
LIPTVTLLKKAREFKYWAGNGNLQTEVSDEQKAIPGEIESKATELKQVMTSEMQFFPSCLKYRLALYLLFKCSDNFYLT